MKILTTIIFIILGLVALVLVIALFVKKDYNIRREITINRSNQDVYNYVKVLKNQNDYNKWWMLDPSAKKTFTGEDGTIGAIAAWDSQDKSMGAGEQEIKSLSEGRKIDYEIRFERPFKNIAHTSLAMDSIGPTQTRVVWVFEGRNKYPMNLMNLFMDKILGGDLETSMSNLKNQLEK